MGLLNLAELTISLWKQLFYAVGSQQLFWSWKAYLYEKKLEDWNPTANELGYFGCGYTPKMNSMSQGKLIFPGDFQSLSSRPACSILVACGRQTVVTVRGCDTRGQVPRESQEVEKGPETRDSPHEYKPMSHFLQLRPISQNCHLIMNTAVV